MNVFGEFCVASTGHENILVNRQHMLSGRCAGAAASATGPSRPLPSTISDHPHPHTPTSLHPTHTHTLCLQTSVFYHLFPKRTQGRKVKLTKMPTNCFSSILVDVTMPRLCCRSRWDRCLPREQTWKVVVSSTSSFFYPPAL